MPFSFQGRRVPLREGVQERGEVDRGDRQETRSSGTPLDTRNRTTYLETVQILRPTRPRFWNSTFQSKPRKPSAANVENSAARS